jgi:hypothetical protein
MSSMSESTYEALHLYAAAARRAGEDEPRTVARELRNNRADFPRGVVTVQGPETVAQQLFLAEARDGVSGLPVDLRRQAVRRHPHRRAGGVQHEVRLGQVPGVAHRAEPAPDLQEPGQA